MFTTGVEHDLGELIAQSCTTHGPEEFDELLQMVVDTMYVCYNGNTIYQQSYGMAMGPLSRRYGHTSSWKCLRELHQKQLHFHPPSGSGTLMTPELSIERNMKMSFSNTLINNKVASNSQQSKRMKTCTRARPCQTSG